MRAPRARPVGLRARVALVFALGALLLSALLSLLTFTFASSFLITQHQSQVVQEAREAAKLLGEVPVTDADASTALVQVGGPDSFGLLYRSRQWFAESLITTPDQLPPAFLEGVTNGEGQLQRVEFQGAPALAVSVPLTGSPGSYVGLFPMATLDDGLRTLTLVLVGASVVTTAFGALLGLWASRRALRPLESLSEAAAAVAHGDLTTRLKVGRDPGLEELARSFNMNTAALQERVERDERFAGDVSHELRSPLTTIANAVEVLNTRKDRLPEEAGEAVDLLGIEVRRLQQLIVDLLEVSRSSSELKEEELDLVLVAEVAEQTANAVAGADVTRVSSAARRAYVRGDARRLQQVVRNLVANAQSHGQGVEEVRVDATRRKVTITVDDRGPGVPQEWRERVFERFTRAPGAASHVGEPGAGLGLALVQRQVALHRGTIRVEDGPSGGRFVVELPREEP